MPSRLVALKVAEKACGEQLVRVAWVNTPHLVLHFKLDIKVYAGVYIYWIDTTKRALCFRPTAVEQATQDCFLIN